MSRAPNTRLRAAVAASGLTYADLARDVRAVATETGTTLRTNPSAVAHWMNGHIPRPETVRALTEALSRRTGSRLTPDDIGMPGPDVDTADLGLTLQDPLTTLTRIGHSDMRRRTLLAAATYSVAAASIPLSDTVRDHADRTTAVLDGGTAGADDVAAIQHMTAAFTAADERFGGQHGRKAVETYLIDEVLPLCRASWRNTQLHNRMLSATASLTHLAGWKAYDAGEHGLAQRYYLQTYALTQEAGDAVHSAFPLRIMAHNGIDLERPEHTLGLAEAALARVHGRTDPATEATFVICRARALAAAGRGPEAVREALRAEDLAHDADRTAMPTWVAMWGNPVAVVHNHTAKILASLGEHAEAERYHANAVKGRPLEEYKRIGGLTMTSQGHAQLAQGHIEQACATYTTALETMQGVHSSRTIKAVAAMRSRLVPFRKRGAGATADLDDKARTWLREASRTTQPHA